MESKRNFAIFILSHGRANNVITLKTLKKQNYTGKWYIICDNEDKTLPEYVDKFGMDRVIVFDKAGIAKKIDEGDNFQNRKVILYARVACFEAAKALGLTHFLELDDDYTDFQYRYIEAGKMKVRKAQIGKVIPLYLDFLDSTDSLTIAFGQGGDMIGGTDAKNAQKCIGRKAMNSFFCRTDKPIPFVGRINEDVNMYTTCNTRGEKIFTYFPMMLTQKQTQSQKGGMTETYIDGGTYIKSFYSVMYSPSCVKIRMMGDNHRRIHHNIQWEHCAPKILDESIKKRR